MVSSMVSVVGMEEVVVVVSYPPEPFSLEVLGFESSVWVVGFEVSFWVFAGLIRLYCLLRLLLISLSLANWNHWRLF